MNLADLPPKLLNKQQQEVWHLHAVREWTFAEISRWMKVSRSRVPQIWHEAQQRLADYEAKGGGAPSLLPGRAKSLMRRFDVPDQAAMREHIQSGRLRWCPFTKRVVMDGKTVRSIGWGTWVAMVEWADLPCPESKPLLAVKTRAQMMAESLWAVTSAATVFRVVDVARSVAFYRDKLRFQVDFMFKKDCAQVSREGCRIHFKRAKREPRNQATLEQQGHMDVCIGVHSITDMSVSFAAEGVRVVVPKRRVRHGYEFCVRDPDGYILGFVQDPSAYSGA